jgi:hypothetical protein
LLAAAIGAWRARSGRRAAARLGVLASVARRRTGRAVRSIARLGPAARPRLRGVVLGIGLARLAPAELETLERPLDQRALRGLPLEARVQPRDRRGHRHGGDQHAAHELRAQLHGLASSWSRYPAPHTVATRAPLAPAACLAFP